MLIVAASQDDLPSQQMETLKGQVRSSWGPITPEAVFIHSLIHPTVMYWVPIHYKYKNHRCLKMIYVLA